MPTASEIIQSMETRFLPSAAAPGYSCRVHIQLRGREANAYTVIVSDGRCTVTTGLVGSADARLDADAETYTAVALGKQRIEWAVLRGRITLDPIPTMRTFSKLFRKPT